VQQHQVKTDTKTDPGTDKPKKDAPKKDVPNKNDQPTKDVPKDQPKNKVSSSSNTSGVIKVQVPRCGPNGATSESFSPPPAQFAFNPESLTEDVTHTTGPNGSIDWLNCGLENGGWNPPFVHINDLITVDLDAAIAQGGPFTKCKPYAWAFKQSGGQLGSMFCFQFDATAWMELTFKRSSPVSPIILASIALQESSCNPHTVGGNGEQGLMQLTKDKCAPGVNCQDVVCTICPLSVVNFT